MIRGRWIPPAEAAVAAEALALGLWLLHPSLTWAAAAFGLGAWGLIIGTRSRQPLLVAAALAGLLGATTAGVTSGRVRTVERRWPQVREDLIRATGLRLAATLQSTVNLARTLAEDGASAINETQTESFERLARAVGRGGPEAGVVVLDSAGRPWSWAGKHRMPPSADSRELYARITPFYVALEARRQTAGRIAVGHVLLAVLLPADSTDPDASVATRFSSGTGASLEFYAPRSAPAGSDVFDYCLPSCEPDSANPAPDTLFTIRTAPPGQGTFKLALLSTGGRNVAIAVLLCLAGLVAAGHVRTRYLALGLTGALFLFTPVAFRLGWGPLFSPATYYLELLDPLTASAGALALSAIIAIIAVVAFRARPGAPRAGAVLGVGVLLITPLAALTLARGISPPAGGVGPGLWLGWEVPLALSIVALIALVAALLPQVLRVGTWIPWMAGAGSIMAALTGLAVWRPEAGFPLWYVYLWVPFILLATQSGGRMRRLIAMSVVAGSAAAILTWGAEADGRLRLARADARRLGDARDPVAIALLERLGKEPGPPPRSSGDLYALWQRSSLAQSGYPAVLDLWSPTNQLMAELPLANLGLPPRLLQALAQSAAEQQRPILEVFDRIPGAHPVLARPFPDGTVLTVGIGPKTRLITPYRVARLLWPESRTPAPYEMSLSEVVAEAGWTPGLVWRREGQSVHGDELLEFPGAGGERHLHVTVQVGEVPGLLIRGALLLFLDIAVIALLWFFGEALLGRTDFIHRTRGVLRLRSYRVRIALALAVFFIVPTVVFATWMAGRIRSDAVRSQDLVIRQSLRDAGAMVREDRLGPGPGDPLDAVADRVGGELLVYRAGALEMASVPLLGQLGLVGSFLPPPVYLGLLADDGGEMVANLVIAGRPARAGFRTIGSAGTVLAMPRLPEDQPMSESDLAYALLLATLIGLGAAAGFARAAARALAEPVGVLRRAAEIVGQGGTPMPFQGEVPDEFVPVAEAFTRMARDVRASQNALEAARQRTVAVLRNVATGVMALAADLRVTLANPRAEELLGCRLEAGAPVDQGPPAEWMPVWAWARDFLRSGSELAGEEFTVGGRRIRVRASALGTEPGGCVVALDDVTELAHAVRVLAWGEMARQVAHEIKNPLTPMRLGIQHLQRAYGEPRGDFERALDMTSRQILAEIDRLDAVARAFARFGAPPVEEIRGPVGPVDLVAVARETVALYALAGNSGVELVTDGRVAGFARPDELREVLVNLVENARNAGAGHVRLSVVADGGERTRITVVDDGRGIRAEDLPRIFEPHFSTNTSGTGLGLAICRRLVESWGGTIRVESQPGEGTAVTVDIRSEGGSPAW